jgi:hypothetical protein
MANSTITKNQTLDKVKHFVRSHLDDTPIIINEHDRVRVGNYICTQHDGDWHASYNDQTSETFTLRSSAVAWCISRISGNLSTCMTIKNQDLQYSRAIENSFIYLSKYKTTKDEFKRDLMWIRYQDSVYQMKTVRSRLTDYLKKIKFS